MFRRFSKSRRSSQASFEDEVRLDINSTPMSHKPCLVIAASAQYFDPIILQQWADEGFAVHYERVHGDSRSNTFAVEAHGDTLEAGEKYAVVCDHLPSHFSVPLTQFSLPFPFV